MSTLISYKCPNCGGPLKFSPEKQNYACEFCLSEFTPDEAENIKPDSATTVKEEETRNPDADTVSAGAVLYSCPSCGAQIVTDETTAASYCYYCHNPVIMEGRLSGEFLPDYVVPFAIDKDKAVDIFNGWIKKKRYIPKAFYAKEQIDKLSGVYFPYLMFSCRVDGQLQANGSKVRTWTAGDYQYTETQRFDVRRNGSMDVARVPRNALKKANRQLIEGVFPFQMDKLLPFSMGYLSGFLAERRDMNTDEISSDVQSEVRQFAERSLKDSAGSYDSLRVENHSENLSNEKWEYALLPVWTLTYHHKSKDKMYYFTVNGQTGKVCGILPVDSGKLAGLFAAVFFPVFFIMLLAGYFI